MWTLILRFPKVAVTTCQRQDTHCSPTSRLPSLRKVPSTFQGGYKGTWITRLHKRRLSPVTGSGLKARTKHLFRLQRGKRGGFANTQWDGMSSNNQVIPLRTMDTRHQPLAKVGTVEGGAAKTRKR